MSVATPALPVRAERLWAALLAATVMNLPLGSVYAFSVLLRPIEQELAIPRSALSLVFGLATVGFTVGSVAAAFLYRVAPAPILVLASALVAAGGIAMAATATRLAQLLPGHTAMPTRSSRIGSSRQAPAAQYLPHGCGA